MTNFLLLLKAKLIEFANREEGATMVEYAIMLALIAIVSIVIITGLGQEVSTTFSIISSSLDTMNG